MENIQEEIEDKVIDTINAGIGGRLIIFKPEKDNFGADLAVERRGKYKEGIMYFKVSSIVTPAKEENFIKDFAKEEFKADKNLYLLFVCFDDPEQKLTENIWLVPSLDFKEMAEVVKLNLLRFTPDKFSKFALKTNELGKLILNAFENKGKIVFKEIDSKVSKINLDNLKEFLCEARKNTYALGSGKADNPKLSGSTQFEFSKGSYFYRDVYFSGDKKFMGQEVVYYETKPIWSTSYTGEQIDKLKEAFLKESLFKLAEKCRLGEFCEYEKRELKYENHGQGSIEEFSGKEEIFLKDKIFYKLTYQGGLL